MLFNAILFILYHIVSNSFMILCEYLFLFYLILNTWVSSGCENNMKSDCFFFFHCESISNMCGFPQDKNMGLPKFVVSQKRKPLTMCGFQPWLLPETWLPQSAWVSQHVALKVVHLQVFFRPWPHEPLPQCQFLFVPNLNFSSWNTQAFSLPTWLDILWHHVSKHLWWTVHTKPSPSYQQLCWLWGKVQCQPSMSELAVAHGACNLRHWSTKLT